MNTNEKLALTAVHDAAYLAGNDAYNAGGNRAPACSRVIMDLIKDNSGKAIFIMNAWYMGWNQASNIAAYKAIA